jgi:hypothetical protein
LFFAVKFAVTERSSEKAGENRMAELIAKSIFILTLCGAVFVYTKIIIETLTQRNEPMEFFEEKNLN